MREVTNKQTGEVTTYTDLEYAKERDRQIMEWDAAKKALEVAKELEMQLRKQVVDFAFDPEQQSGTERIELGEGYELKAVKKVTYGFIQREGKLDRKAIEIALQRIETRTGAGEYIAENLVKWNPILSLTEYKKLEEADRQAIDGVLVTNEGAPTLEIIAPKGK